MRYDRQITITTGANRKSLQWLPQTMLVSAFYKRLEVPVKSKETLSDYMRMPKGQQDDLKDVGGFVAGTLNGTRRKANAITGRDIITLDMDNLANGQTAEIIIRLDNIGCGYCVYSTRKHTQTRPRIRVLIPTDRTMTADEYEPCARKLAEYIGIGYCDPTTFEASRMMFFPSISRDGEYVYKTADKPFAQVSGLLATYKDWRDSTSWPICPGAIPVARLAAKQGDPTEKKGIVGAFCRAYDVPTAMGRFLPGVYDKCDTADNRYTFLGGSTTGGAVLYEDGKFLYSHHATDPCSCKLVNAFDLVRLHCFGDLDDEAKPGTPASKLPSFKAMAEKAAADEAVGHRMMEERWESARAAFTHQGVTGTGPEPEADTEWRKKIRVNGNGVPEKSLYNLRLVLEQDPMLAGKIQLNLFSGRTDATGVLPWERPSGKATWTDEDTAQLRIYLESLFGKIPKLDILDALQVATSDQAYHPVRDYLNSLVWDGVQRLDTMFIDYLGAGDSAYTRAVTRKSFVAAVARIMMPGCKYDTMSVLVGAQGRFKSTILAKMGGEWFSDSLRTFGDKDSMETIQGTWVNEIPELQALRKADIEGVKAFLSKTHDYYRAAYGRYTADRPRQCVFFGTTNSRECLTDTTGNRRFWVIDIDQQERTKDVWADLDEERDQLWAEAVARWRVGEALHLPKELEAVAIAIQEEHRQRHPWEGLIAEFIEKPVPVDWLRWTLDQRLMFWAGNAKTDEPLVPRSRVCAAEIWCEMLGKQKGDFNKKHSRDINDLLERMPGYKVVGIRFMGEPYGKQRCFSGQHL